MKTQQMEKPASVVVDGTPLCTRCGNNRRARIAANPGLEPDTAPVTGAVTPAPAPLAVPSAAPTMMAKSDYLLRYGPSNNRDLIAMIRDLEGDNIMLLPMREGEAVKTAVKRYRRMLGKDSGFVVEGSESHGHVFVEKEES